MTKNSKTTTGSNQSETENHSQEILIKSNDKKFLLGLIDYFNRCKPTEGTTTVITILEDGSKELLDKVRELEILMMDIRTKNILKVQKFLNKVSTLK